MTKEKEGHELAIKYYVGLTYLSDLDRLVEELPEEDDESSARLTPFLLMAAGTLEAVLNDEIVSWAHETFPRDRYQAHAKALLDMKFPGKLNFIVPLLTGNNFMFRTNSKDFLSLRKLISRRNQLIHATGFYRFGNFDEDGEVISAIKGVEPKNNEKEGMGDLMDGPDKVTRAECIEYHKAIDAFHTKFLYLIDEAAVEENDMIIRNVSRKLDEARL